MKMNKIKFNSRKVIILTKLFFHIANILLNINISFFYFGIFGIYASNYTRKRI